MHHNANRAALWAATLLLALGGCSSSGGTTPAPTPTPTPSPSPKLVEVGFVTDTTAGTGYRTLASSDSVGYATLGQGGFHIWGAVKVRTPVLPQNINVAFKITRASDNTVIFNGADSTGLGPLMTLNADGDGFTNVAGGNQAITGFLCQSTTECRTVINGLIGQKVTLAMSVRDSSGRTGTDSVTVTFTGQPLP